MVSGCRAEVNMAVWYFINLVPRAFSSFKMAVGETPGQGYLNTPRIVECFVTWHIMKQLFRRLVLAFGGPVCFLQSESVAQTERRHFKVFTWHNSNEFLEPFWRPWPGVSPTAILNEEKALGDEVGTSSALDEQRFVVKKLRCTTYILKGKYKVISLICFIHYNKPKSRWQNVFYFVESSSEIRKLTSLPLENGRR